MSVTEQSGANAAPARRPREGRWGNIPALPAVIPRCVGRRQRGPSPCLVKAKPSGLPAARANHARRPVRGPSGAETGAARMGRSIIERTEPIGSVRQLVFDLPAPIPVTEGELRALEILLGGSLKALLAETTKRPLKRRSDR